MAAATDISDAGVAFIASFEGFVATPYNDPSGNCTVGYGFLMHFGNCTPDELAQPPISEADGMVQLRAKLRLYVAEVVNNCRPLAQNELDALASLCYNIGRSGFARSSVRAAVNAGGDVCAELRQYVHGSDGTVLPGLVRRREAECQLFMEEEGVTQAQYDELKGDLANILGTLSTKADDQKVNDLANAVDVLPATKSGLRFLWAAAAKAWPFGP